MDYSNAQKPLQFAHLTYFERFEELRSEPVIEWSIWRVVKDRNIVDVKENNQLITRK